MVPAPSFDARATLAAIAAERCTAVYGVPTMFVSQLEHPDFARFDLTSLRTGIMSGAPCPLPLMEKVVSRMGIREICIGYGQTEASPLITLTSVDDPIEVRVGTVGHPIPGLEVKLVGPASRGEVPTGRDRRVVCPRALRDGRLLQQSPGDRQRDRSRRLAPYRRPGPAPRGRQLSDRGPEPRADHSRRRKHLSRPRSRSSCTVIRPSPRSPWPAFPTPSTAKWSPPGSFSSPARALQPDELKQYCHGQIAHFKVPQYVMIVESLPRTVTGKIRKHVLRDQAIDDLGLKEAAQIETA